MAGPLYRVKDDEVTFVAALLEGVCCAPLSMPGEEVERRVRALDVCGTSHGWGLSEKEKPTTCKDDPNRRHWRMEC